MTMYRKTALVRAEQFLPSEGKIPDGVFSDGLSDPRRSTAEWCLQTLEGRHTLRNGDYICTGPTGEKWNVEQSIFEATYEAASPPAREEAPAEGAGDFDGLEEHLAKLEASEVYAYESRIADLESEILTLRNRTSEPEAGEAYGWVYEELAPGPDWCAGLEWWPAKFTKKPPKPETSRNVVPLYTRPAPATADKLRAAIDDVISHEGDWRTALMAMDAAEEEPEDGSGKPGYWLHQIKVLDRILAALNEQPQ